MPVNEKHTDKGTEFVDSNTSRSIITLNKYGVYSGLKDKVTFQDDFLGDALEDGWAGTNGANTVVPAITTAISGKVRLTSGVVGNAFATDGVALPHALNWRANAGNLEFEARAALVTTAANCASFIGFTDSVSLEEPVSLNNVTFNSVATDAVGFVYDTNAATDTWRFFGVKGDTDATAIDTGIAPTADTAQRFRIEVSAAGHAVGYIDDVRVGEVVNAVTATVALTPIFTHTTRTTAARSMDVDYIRVSSDRV